MIMSEAIKKSFDAVSEKYDHQRRSLIPCFDDFYSVPLELSEQVENVQHILDIGAGTGLVSAFFHEKYPNATITLVDFSIDMLNKAKDRFNGKPNFKYVVADFAEATFEAEKYDLVVSGLAIHHLVHELKQLLFKKIYGTLKQGGWFINADQVQGITEEIDALYKNNWQQKVKASALTEEEKQSAFKRVQLDIMAPLNSQLQWLKDAGFATPNCYYQYYNFVVFGGKK
jgi:tRNA (cmo5U34)-methyltransferase